MKILTENIMKKIVIIAWILCGIVNWGATLGNYMLDPQRMESGDSRNHYGIAAGMALGGCITFPIVLLHTNFYQYGFDWE